MRGLDERMLSGSIPSTLKRKYTSGLLTPSPMYFLLPQVRAFISPVSQNKDPTTENRQHIVNPLYLQVQPTATPKYSKIKIASILNIDIFLVSIL
jgi:hypothetical protein